MALPSVEINHLAVFLAAITSLIFGTLWHGPFFGKIWLSETGLSKSEINKLKKKNRWKFYLTNFFANLILVYVLVYFVNFLALGSLIEGLQVGFLFWLGFFAVTVLLREFLFGLKSLNLYLVESLFWLFNLLIILTILMLWR